MRILPILSTIIFFNLSVVAPASLKAQKKPISYQQAFENAPTELYQPLPKFERWLDSNRFLISKPIENSKNENHFIVNIPTKSIKPIQPSKRNYVSPHKSSKLPADLKHFTVSPDFQYAAYTYNNNLYLVHISSEEITQLTSDGSDSILNGYAPWLYYEEIFGNYKAFWWNNNSKQLVFMRFDESKVPLYPIVTIKNGITKVQFQRYPRAGETNPSVKIGIVNIENKKLTWADFNENHDQYFRTPYFTPQNKIWVQWVNRNQDSLTIFEIDPDNGNKKGIYNETTKTWVTQNDGAYFIEGKEYFINRSDKSGWSHYYLHDMQGKLINQITNGNFNVGYIVKFDSITNSIFFTARKENSTRIDLYKIGIDGKGMKRLTGKEFSYTNFSISPQNNYFIASYSNISTPSALSVFDMNGNEIIDVGSVKGSGYKNFHLPKKEIKRTKSTDGLYDLPFIITYPINFDKNKKYPVIMNIYGGPYAMNVNDTWSLPTTEIWWAQEGIIQVWADNRASGHFGKKAIDEIHRITGIKEIEDFMAIGKWLKQQPWVDTSKLLITGFSNGGYLTCMGLTYGSSVFNYGIAYWPVTDLNFVDSYFIERYMRLPKDNGEGYQQTSVMQYANNYRGLLRIVHGDSDDNAHLENTIALVDKFQRLNKKFEFMIYPGAGHGLSGEQWKHNKHETYRFYYENLLNRKLAKEFD